MDKRDTETQRGREKRERDVTNKKRKREAIDQNTYASQPLLMRSQVNFHSFNASI
jgi:hypothetical protein